MNQACRFVQLGLLLLVAVFCAELVQAQKTPGYNTLIPEKIMTPDKVQTSIGELNFFDGMPDSATTQKMYDNLATMRGMEAFLNGMPAASLEAIREGQIEACSDASNKVEIFDHLMKANSLFLTGNAETVYASAILDLKKTDLPSWKSLQVQVLEQ